MSTILVFELDGLMVYYITLSDKFGPVKFYWTGEPPGTDYRENLLIGCIIDSVIYGNLVSVESEQFPASNFSLSQNYPNPFNPTTKIKYTIPDSPLPFGKGLGVRLIVYDLLGREIATLVNEEKPAGEYEVEFKGSTLTSGIYFYQLKAGEFVETRKMVLLR